MEHNILLDKIINKIKNKPLEQNTLIGTVYSLSPFKFTIFPGDTPIPAVQTTSLIGLKVGSRILLQRYLNQYIAIAIIGESSIRLIEQSSTFTSSDTTFANTNLSFSFEAGCKYNVFLSLGSNGDDANGLKLDWTNTGTIPSNQVRRTNGQAFGQTDRENSNVVVRQSYFSTAIKYGCADSNAIQEWFILQTTTAGIMTLRAAKYANTVTGTDTTVSGTSYIIVEKIA